MTMPQIRLTLISTLLAVFALGCQSKPNAAGHELLNAYMDSATGMGGSPAAMMKALDEQDSKVDSLKGRVPDSFIKRYHRLINATRLAIAQTRDDRARQQIAEFVQSVTGMAPPLDDKKLTIAAAGAFSEEVLLLDMLLDGETNRNKVREKFAERLRARRKA